MMRFEFPVEITEDEEGFYLVQFPDLQGTATDGRTMDEAMAEARDCLNAALAHRIKNQLPIPTPTAAHGRLVVSPSPLIAEKTASYLSHRKKRG